jgi:ceramide glucosyltransferase
MLIQLSMISLSTLIVIAIVWSYLRLRGSIQPRARPTRLDAYPSVTVIHPIKGLDAGAERNLDAALSFDYPGQVDSIFVLDDENDPAVPVVRAALLRSRAEAQLLFSGPPRAGMTGKLNAMILGLAHAHGELVAFLDSDTRPSAESLTTLVTTLLTERDAGAAFAPVYVSCEAKTIGDAGYALLLNGLYGAGAADAARRAGDELPFIMGQFMVFKREAIADIGGLECAAGQLVDDMYLGRRLKEVGYRNMVAPVRVPIVVEKLGLAEFAGIYLRWIVFSRTGLTGWSFKRLAWVEGALFWIGLLLMIGCLLLNQVPAAVAMSMIPIAVSMSINSLHVAVGGVPLRLRHLWIAAGLMITAPVLMAVVYTSHQVTWRGRTYRLDHGARLSSF